MARPRRTTRNPQQNPRNAGLNRTASMRGNNRNIGQNQPFQGGISQGSVMSPQGPGQGMQQCPPGQEPGRDPNTGAQICKPAQPNISGNVPVNNANRAIAPNPGKPLKQGY
mgnify:CR=1 FL=1